MKRSSGRTRETAASAQMSVFAAWSTCLHHISSYGEAPTTVVAFLSLASRNLPTDRCEKKKKKKSYPSASETADNACTKINAVLWARDRTGICAFLKITALSLSLCYLPPVKGLTLKTSLFYGAGKHKLVIRSSMVHSSSVVAMSAALFGTCTVHVFKAEAK